MSKFLRLIYVLVFSAGLAWRGATSLAADAAKPDAAAETMLDISKPLNQLPAVTPSSTPADIARAIQGRFDFLNDQHLGGRVFIPQGRWPINRPIFMNGDNKELVGAGIGKSVLVAADGYQAMPMVNAGSRTAVEQRPLQDVNRVSLVDPAARILDESVSGPRIGLRTYGEYPSDHFPASVHHLAVKDAKPWAKGTAYKTDDAIDLHLPGAPGPSLAFCVRDHVAAAQNEPGKGPDWRECWVIQVPAHVQVVGDALANGAYDPAGRRATDWAGMEHFTLDFAFVQNVETSIYKDRRMLCGVVSDNASNQVWKVSVNARGDLTLDLGLAGGTGKSVRLADGCQAAGLYRLAVQVDFPTHTIDAWIAKPGSTELVRTCNDSKTLPADAHFHQLEYGYFIIAGGDNSPSGSNGHNLPPTDITVCGLHTSAVLRYADEDKLLRRDLSKTDDNVRYFANDDGTLALLPLTDAPGDADGQTGKLLVTIEHGDAAGDHGQKGYGLLKVPQGIYGMGRPRISDLTIRPGPVWGAGILTWHTLAMQLTDVDIRGGFYAIGDLYYGAQYTFDVRNCRLSGSEAAWNGSSNIIYMKNVTIDPVGRYGLLLSGSNIQMSHVTFGDPQLHQSEYYFRHTGVVGYGGMNLLEDVHADAPAGSVYPSKAAFSQETIPYSRTSLVLRDCSVANMGPNASLIELPFRSFRSPGTLLVERTTYGGNPIGACLRVGSPWWTGRVIGIDPHGPMHKLLDARAPAFPIWESGKKYRKGDHVLVGAGAWEAIDDHTADASNMPGADDANNAHWRRAMSSIVFE